MASLIPFISKSSNHEYNWYRISNLILKEIFQNQINEKELSSYVAEIESMKDDDLLRYGFLKKNYIPPAPMNGNNAFGRIFMGDGHYQLIYSEKLERYKYWLDVSGKMREYTMERLMYASRWIMAGFCRHELGFIGAIH
ncbi:MAG: hypothetical protein ACXWT3_09000 [Methylococcaceae bacterium]